MALSVSCCKGPKSLITMQRGSKPAPQSHTNLVCASFLLLSSYVTLGKLLYLSEHNFFIYRKETMIVLTTNKVMVRIE